ncbi:hypothetical protein DFH09DRAFT_1097148 [Mycena vulgaris]|nr:hypothetical protein DFH09DRAFT_1097148 [Mycena vulgaris]
MLLTLVLGMNIVTAKIKPKPTNGLVFDLVGLARLSAQDSIAYTLAASESSMTPAFEYFCSKMTQKEFGGTIAYHHISEQNIVKKVQALESEGDEKYTQARFSAKRANGLAKPTNGLARGWVKVPHLPRH